MQEDKDSLSQEKRGAGQPPHQPTEEQIEQVKAFVKVGVMGKVIADYLGISEPTFYKHYRKHIDKAQMRWAEKKEIAHSADSSNFKVVFQESDE